MSTRKPRRAERDPARTLSIGDVARELGCCYELARRLVHQKIPHERVSERMIRVRREDLDAYKAACRVRPTA